MKMKSAIFTGILTIACYFTCSRAKAIHNTQDLILNDDELFNSLIALRRLRAAREMNALRAFEGEVSADVRMMRAQGTARGGKREAEKRSNPLLDKFARVGDSYYPSKN